METNTNFEEILERLGAVFIKSKKCSTCQQIRPVEDFYKSSYRKDGYTPQCKKCHDAASLRRRVPTRDDANGLKKCPRCEQWLPLASYRQGKKSSYCRDCQAEYQRKQNPPSPALKQKKKLFDEIKGDPAAYKWCTLGKNYHLKADFNLNRARSDGLDSSCRACRREYQRNRKDGA
jgi:hypothetical protein